MERNAGLVIGVGAVCLWCWARVKKGFSFCSSLAASLALSSSLFIGHAQTARPRLGMLAADAARLGAGALWLGGLVAVLVTWREAESVPIVRRFSTIALGSAVGAGISGAAMALMIIPRISQILTTGYGRVLLTKLSLIAAVLVVAWMNRRTVHRAQVNGSEQRRVRRRMMNEVAMIAAVLAVTGLLSNVSASGHPPARIDLERV